MISLIISASVTLIAMYLLLSNSGAAQSVISSLASGYVKMIGVLQGR